MITKPRATVEELHAVTGKAEIVKGELVAMSPAGARPGRAAGKVFASLNRFEEEHGGGFAFGDNVGFIVDLPHRTSFSPDAAWYVGSLPSEEDLEFVPGAPVFAVEVRSKDGYGPGAERRIAEKIRDYFAAGTQVVWDVDLRSEAVVRAYRANDPENPVLYGRSDVAEAEPAVPGWRLPVARLFE